MPAYESDRLPSWMLGAGLIIYDLLAMSWSHRYYDAFDLRELCPQLNEHGLRGGYRFFDAQTDDARLVLRVIREGVASGGSALNYSRVSGLLHSTSSSRICGVQLQDQVSGKTTEVQAKVVINATGAWADHLRQKLGAQPRLRRLRGSHLILPFHRLPLTRAVSLWHPWDQRPVFVFPWEGVILVGTTDVDHAQEDLMNPVINKKELAYLLLVLQFAFPEQSITEKDVLATFSGIRPVVNTGKADPSRESREHVLWDENGLITVTGGKLTTFRCMAVAALKAACRSLPGCPEYRRGSAVLDQSPEVNLRTPDIHRKVRTRLAGRFGHDAGQLVECALSGEMETIPGTSYHWAELRWAARAEAVQHLDDVLLRRVRLGLLLPNGGLEFFESIRQILQPELGWDDARWQQELKSYSDLWNRCYHLPTH
jgi:glycerol-3-phosphate dehydrogenase